MCHRRALRRRGGADPRWETKSRQSPGERKKSLERKKSPKERKKSPERNSWLVLTRVSKIRKRTLKKQTLVVAFF